MKQLLLAVCLVWGGIFFFTCFSYAERGIVTTEGRFEYLLDDAEKETDKKFNDKIISQLRKNDVHPVDKRVHSHNYMIRNAVPDAKGVWNDGCVQEFEEYADNRYGQHPRNVLGQFERRPVNFWEQLEKDTKEVLGKDGRFYYAVASDEGGKVGASTTLLAWKFLAVEAAITNNLQNSNSKGNLEFVFPIRIERIPIGGGREVRDTYRKVSYVDGGWYDKLVIRVYGSQSPTSGMWALGWRVGYEL